MIRRLLKQVPIILLLLWVVASSPFLSTFAVSAHGHHEASLSINGSKIDVAFHHDSEEHSHSHEAADSHQHDSEESHSDEHRSQEHNATISVDDIRATSTFAPPIPELSTLFVFQKSLNSLEGITSLTDLSVFDNPIDKPPSSQASLKATVLLI